MFANAWAAHVILVVCFKDVADLDHSFTTDLWNIQSMQGILTKFLLAPSNTSNICIYYTYIYNIHIYIISIKLSKQLKVQNITIKSSFGDNICLDHLLPNKNTPNMLDVCLHSKLNFVVVVVVSSHEMLSHRATFQVFPGSCKKKVQEPEENRPVFPGMKQSCVQIYFNAG